MLPSSLSLKPCLSHISHQVRVDYRELEGTSVKAGRLEFELGDGTGGEAIRLALMSMRRAETARVRLRRRLLAPPLAEVEEEAESYVLLELTLLSFEQVRSRQSL